MLPSLYTDMRSILMTSHIVHRPANSVETEQILHDGSTTHHGSGKYVDWMHTLCLSCLDALCRDRMHCGVLRCTVVCFDALWCALVHCGVLGCTVCKDGHCVALF